MVQQHPSADAAVLFTEDEIPGEFEQFRMTDQDFKLGAPTHCFGMVTDAGGGTNMTQRVIGGIIQRDFIHEDSTYKSQCVELSVPIPTGMSGGPAFYAHKPGIAIGIAIGSLQSEVVVHTVSEYENDTLRERERISRIVEYGVVLRLFPIKNWLESVLTANR